VLHVRLEVRNVGGGLVHRRRLRGRDAQLRLQLPHLLLQRRLVCLEGLHLLEQRHAVSANLRTRQRHTLVRE
jgi:hypothetical protein